MASPITQPGDRTGQSPSPKAPTGIRNRVFLVILAVAAAVALAVGGVIPGLALAATSPFRIVPSPQPGHTRLKASVAISATDVWAVGSFNDGTNTLAEHWNGSVWQVVATPTPSLGNFASLDAVSAVSSTDVWAAGNAGTGEHASAGFIEHWNGTKWSIVASPSLAQSTPQLTSIVAISSTNVYAVGSYYTGGCAYNALVEHWNGSTWSIIPTAAPCDAAPTGVSASSASDVWVVGAIQNMQATAFTEHFNGHAWTVVSSPASPSINAVVDVSPTNVWTVGNFDISHWNGTSWKVVTTLKLSNVLSAITSVSATDLWAVGYTAVGNNPEKTLAEHFNGTAWSVVPTPNPNPSTGSFLTGVSSTASGHVYAVGITAPDNFTLNGLILENDNG